MNLFSYMVTKNEADRYLFESLSDLRIFTNGVLVYDDSSDDETAELAHDCGAIVIPRPEGVLTFMEDESVFRGAAWCAMEDVFRPKLGDWILTLDADEMLIPGRDPIDTVIAEAVEQGADGILMRVREMWDDSGRYERIDGFWGTITALRLVAYKPNGLFAPRTQGGGSVPGYVVNPIPTAKMEIHHYGYAEQADREAKYARYSQSKGHSRKHIESILKPPELREVNS